MHELASLFATGLPGLQDVAVFLARVVVGLMFFLSGFYKLFTAKQAEKMAKTMVEAGVAAPRATGRFVSMCELLFGALLVIGLLTSLAAAVLAVICVVALVTVASKLVAGTSLSFRLSSYLDLPETLLLVILVWVIANGPGLYSLDQAVFA